MSFWAVVSIRDVVGLVCGHALGFGLYLFVEWLRRRFDCPFAVTRKLVHIGAGMLVWFLPLLFDHWYVGIVPFGTFTALNLWFHRRQMFRSMNDESSTLGAVYFAFSVTLLFAVLWRPGGEVDHAPVAVAAVMAMTWGDAAAALVGRRWGRHTYSWFGHTRSWEGSLAMAGASFTAVAITLLTLPESALSPTSIAPSLAHAIFFAIVTAGVATAAEALSPRGADNLTVPLISAATLLALYQAAEAVPGWRGVIGCAASLAVAAEGYRREWLSESGGLAVFVVGSLVFGLAGWVWAFVILTFFVTASVLSRHRREEKRAVAGVFEKGSRRDHGQVLANTGLGCIAAALFAFDPARQWFAAFIGAMAAVTADTWATEIGLLARRWPRLVTTWQRVDPGTSGGVTSIGSLATVAGALVIGAAAQSFVLINGGALEPRILIASLAGGVSGSLSDSLLGATLQAQYYSRARGRTTEREQEPDGTVNEYRRGLPWLGNDAVNFASSVVGAAIGALCWRLS